jgi:hypothetical protein
MMKKTNSLLEIEFLDWRRIGMCHGPAFTGFQPPSGPGTGLAVAILTESAPTYFKNEMRKRALRK